MLSSQNQPITSAKAYPTLDSQNVKHITALGTVCSAIQRLPTSAVLSEGLEKNGTMAVASGGLTDIWRGDLGNNRVAIKAFRIYPAQNLREAKEVSKRYTIFEIRPRTKFADSLETGTCVDETFSSKHLTISWRKHDALPALSSLRLGD